MAGLVPAIHAYFWCQGVDARDKRGHDGEAGANQSTFRMTTGCALAALRTHRLRVNEVVLSACADASAPFTAC